MSVASICWRGGFEKGDANLVASVALVGRAPDTGAPRRPISDSERKFALPVLSFMAPLPTLLALACLASFVPGARVAGAQDLEALERADAEGVEEMIVSASRSPRSRASVPSFSTVIEGEDLEKGVSTSLMDALRFVPGLRLVQEGGRGGRAAFYLRGLDPNHVVVLIDGVRLNDPTNQRGGSFDPSSLALVDIERVEVIRGPLSSIHGSDALAGVINVITKEVARDAPLKARVSARGGRFHDGNVIGEASSGIGDGVAGLSFGIGYDTFRDPYSSGGYDGVNLKAKIDTVLPLEIDSELFTRMHWGSSRGFPGSSGGRELAGLGQVEDRQVREILLGASFRRKLGSRSDLVLRTSGVNRREDVDSPGIDPEPLDPGNFNVVPPSKAGDEYTRWEVALDSTTRLPQVEVAGLGIASRVVAGLGYVHEEGESDTRFDFGGGYTPFPFYDDRDTLSFFGEIETVFGSGVVLSGSLRYDATPDEEDRLSPSGGITVDVPHTPLSVFASYGRGFKRPSFYSLDNPLVGNPDLQVERARGFEVGIRGESSDGRLRGQVGYFDIRVNDLIDFDNSGAVPTLINRSRLSSRGVEFDLHWSPVDWLKTQASFTFDETAFRKSARQPENRPEWQGFGEVTLSPFEAFEASVRLLLVGPVFASSFATGDRQITLAGYERVDVRGAWKPSPAIELFVEIQNLTDRTYREAVGFESPGIAPRIGLSLRR